MSKNIILSYTQLFIPCTFCEGGSCKRKVCHCGSVHCDRLGVDKRIEFTSKNTRHHYAKPSKKNLKCYFCKASTTKGDYDRCYGYYEINYKSKKSYLVLTPEDSYIDRTLIPICCKHTHNGLRKLLLTNLIYGFCYVAVPNTHYSKHLSMIYNDHTYVLSNSNFVQCSFCKFFYCREPYSHPPLAIKFRFGKEMKGKNMCHKCYEKYKVDRR